MKKDVTQLLIEWSKGDSQALADLMPMVYNELRRLAVGYMRRERADHTLQPTALVHEAYLQLIRQDRVQWKNRAHFFAIAAKQMRRITVKHARWHHTQKRGGQAVHLTLDEQLIGGTAAKVVEILALDEALERLMAFDPRQGRIVELRFFGGLTIEEVAASMELSSATVKREWRMARAWLRHEMASGEQLPSSEPEFTS